MAPLLTFIIPVRHQDNARDWNLLKTNLSQTIASIANQDHDGWQAIIVANEGADLPPLPDKFQVEPVTFPPNQLHERGDTSLEVFHDAFRLDKGRRVLRGMLRSRQSRFFMLVDDDDFVSTRIAGFVAKHTDSNGWRVDQGYIWDGGHVLFRTNSFNHLCGTSLIVRADLYQLPERFEDASHEWMKTMLGSHRRIGEILAEAGTPLSPLPFPGAIYRVGHPGSHSRMPGVFEKYFWNREALRHPLATIKNLFRLKPFDHRLRQEFLGPSYASAL